MNKIKEYFCQKFYKEDASSMYWFIVGKELPLNNINFMDIRKIFN